MKTASGPEPRPLPAALRALAAAVPVALVSYAGSRITVPAIPSWYAGLAKPPFTPPNALFAPAWTLLFVLMAIALYRVLSRPPDTPGRTHAVAAYAVQLGLNCLWSLAFFGARSPTLGLIVIAAFLGAIVWTTAAFHRVDRIAASLMLPYIAWVLFATYLNAGIRLLNGPG